MSLHITRYLPCRLKYRKVYFKHKESLQIQCSISQSLAYCNPPCHKKTLIEFKFLLKFVPEQDQIPARSIEKSAGGDISNKRKLFRQTDQFHNPQLTTSLRVTKTIVDYTVPSLLVYSLVNHFAFLSRQVIYFG